MSRDRHGKPCGQVRFNASDLVSVILRPTRCNRRSIKCSPSDLHGLIASAPPSNPDSNSLVWSERHDMLLSNIPDHSSHGPAHAWRKIVLHSEANPDQAVLTDRRGRNCLHAACAKRPTPEAIRALLKHCTDLCQRDNHGRTPLAIAISSNASIEVISALLVDEKGKLAARVADNAHNLPLHLLASGGHENTAEEENFFSLVIDAFPDAAAMEASGGRTPLHIAVECGVGPEIIRILALAEPKAVVMDKCGVTPLILAIRQNAPTDTIMHLVNTNPLAINKRDWHKGRLPLHHAADHHAHAYVMNLLCDSAETARARDFLGRTALHLALEYGTPIYCVVRLLLEKDPTISLMMDNYKKKPLHMACNRYIRLVTTNSKQPHQRERSSELWSVIRLLLVAARVGSVHDKHLVNFRMLHAAVACGVSVEFIKRLLALPTEDLRLTDARGKRPLTLALERPVVDEPVVRELLCAFPIAASIPDRNGRFALSAVAQNGWIGTETLQHVISAFPRALGLPDPESRLYPFMLAALPRGEDGAMTGGTQDAFVSMAIDFRRDLLQLNMIYELIKACPDFILIK